MVMPVNRPPPRSYDATIEKSRFQASNLFDALQDANVVRAQVLTLASVLADKLDGFAVGRALELELKIAVVNLLEDKRPVH